MEEPKGEAEDRNKKIIKEKKNGNESLSIEHEEEI
jgi:hypothetical protein